MYTIANELKNRHINLQILKSIDYREWARSLGWALLFAFLFRSFFFEPFQIPTGSMIPNLMVGDRIFVSKYHYGYSRYSFSPLDFLAQFKGRFMAFNAPARGDIIVFKPPHDYSKWYVKRLIGLPGDVIQMKGGILYVNGKMINDHCDGVFKIKGKFSEDIIFNKCTESFDNLQKSALYNVIYHSSNTKYKHPNTTEKYVVPPKHYFFMGDNRDNSIDSRFLDVIGYVPEENLVGKVQIIFWDANTIKGNFSRLFKGL